jgi:two-component system LytT family response regulator
MKCMVVDDEPLAKDLIDGYIQKTPFLELTASFSNPFKALAFLTGQTVDLLFLDINMPELSGIQLLKSLPVPPPVIFTTAYSEFAAESYDYGAVDYLLKPVKYERFLKAVNRAGEIKGQSTLANAAATGSEPQRSGFVLIKSGTQINKVRTDQILYVEGAGNYMTFYTRDKKIMSLLSMTEVLELLPPDQFVRVHKSYIVNPEHIDIIEKHRVIINKQSIPIGVTYRDHVFPKIGHPE